MNNLIKNNEQLHKTSMNNLIGNNGESCLLSGPDFSKQQLAQKIIKNKTDLLIFVPSTKILIQERTINLIQEIKSKQKNLTPKRSIPIFGSDSLYSEEILTQGDNVEGIVVVVPWHADQNDEFNKRANKMWKTETDASWRTAMAYDATKAILKASSKVDGELTRKKLQEVLLKEDFEFSGATGLVKFNSDGDREGIEACPVMITDSTQTENKTPLYFFKSLSCPSISQQLD